MLSTISSGLWCMQCCSLCLSHAQRFALVKLAVCFEVLGRTSVRLCLASCWAATV